MKKRNKLVSIALSLVIMLGLFVFPSEIAGAEFENAPLVASDEPVIPDESEFSYRPIPVNNPTRVTITGYSGSASKIIIPETLGGLPVEIVASTAFSNNQNITYIKIPSTVKTLAGNTFAKCYSLTDIDVDEGNDSFVSIDGVVYRKNSDSSSEGFGKAESLAIYPAGKKGAFTVPYGITSIGSKAFYYCINLTELNMHNTVTEIEAYALAFCWNLENLRLSDNLKTIGDRALESCDSLKKLVLPSTLEKIGTDAFLGSIDSKDNKVYYFTEGAYCEKGTYAYNYLVGQHLPLSIIKPMHRTVTDAATGISFVDAYSVLPKKYIDISITPLGIEDFEELFPVRYKKAFVFDISLTDENGNEYTPSGYFILNFNGVAEGCSPIATKIFKLSGNRLVSLNGAPNTPFAGAQVTSTGTFAILINDDFSMAGDIDGDGKITLYDAKTALYQATGLIKLPKEQMKAANVDKSADGKVTTADARLILRHAAGIINKF